ncbi:RHS repeat protein [Xenorhabdus szentirmaii]|uniref:RHS repeat protein n=1 Tax=Xenorhabdus szentirmaii TaxID=290112 RepID=UPI0019C676C9|nr:RHS repeat domain-containing protein [Xenorhabdus sp. 5]MBD2824816.1 RHS repeat protein [Xenorhabdus sp. 5]
MNMSLYSKTPSVTVLDNRGLRVRDIAYHRHPNTPDTTDQRITRHQYDTRGFLKQSADPRLHEAGLANFTWNTDMTGNVLRTQSADAGITVTLNDAAGRPFMTISNIGTSDGGTEDKSQAVTRTWQYEDDSLPGRPLGVTEQVTGEVARVAERFVYAGHTDAEKAYNLAGKCILHYDTAGLLQTNSVTLTGVPLSVTRCLLKDADNPDTMANWQGEGISAWNDLLDGIEYVSLTTTDATGTVLTTTDARGNQQRVAYDVAGRLSGSWLTLKGGTEQTIVASLTYSAAGQKLREEHGNGVVTTYEYEPQTQRLIRIKTVRPTEHESGQKVLQDLRYEYDPVGNVLTISNDAEETRFWRNQKVVPESTYVYDSLYQLVSATGREMANAGQQMITGPTLTHPIPTDSAAFTTYTRTYSYDRGNNLTQIRHSAPATGNNYTTTVTVSNRSNRAVLSTLTENPADVDMLFNANGSQRQLQPGQGLNWTLRSELLKVMPVTREGSAADDNENYCYDGDSQRLLKVSTQKTGNSTQTQRVTYLPRLELRTTTNGNTETENLQVITVGEAGRAQVRVLHWENGKPADIDNNQLRYSYGTLTGSSGLEVDGEGVIISLEEYYPYGGTAIWTARSAVEADYKTVRYSGKERDASGLYYYGYRYYQPWAGRWLSADPAGTVDGLNLFRMVRNNPTSGYDDQGLMWKSVASGAAAAATMGYEAYKHANLPKEIERSSAPSFGNDRIHALNTKVTEKQNNFSLMDKINKNLSGRGKVISDFAKGEVPAHESISNQKKNIAALAEFSQTGNIAQLETKPILSSVIADQKNNIPTRIMQVVRGGRTVTTMDSGGIKELMETKDKIIEDVKDTAAVGISIGLAGNAIITAAKVAIPVAAIPLTIAQVAWGASSVGKIVNDTNEVVKTHLDKSEISHKARTEALNQIKKLNEDNRPKILSSVKDFMQRKE